MLRLKMLFSGVSLLIGSGMAFAQSSRLELADAIKLVDCSPVASKPCFRLNLNVTNAKGEGERLPAELSEPIQLARNLTIHVSGQDIKPFYALPTTKESPETRIALILIDTSGSMGKPLPTGETRFEAAKRAANQFLQDFNSAADRVAIVAFESHNVRDRIKQADFVTTAQQAHQQIESLPKPGGNTALYAATQTGIEVLNNQQQRFLASKVMLVVMTDGEDDIRETQGDDHGLIHGPAGLQELVKKRQESGIPVYAVGFGEIDAAALAQMTGDKYWRAESIDQLMSSLARVRSLQINQLQATFASPWDRPTLLNRGSFQVAVSLRLPTGTLESNSRQWLGPGMSVPNFQGLCTKAESQALLRVQQREGGREPWEESLRAILVLAGLALFLVLLWFGLPRLIWPERFGPNFGPAGVARWSGARSSPTGNTPLERAAPPGFTTRKPISPQRGPSDATNVQPKTDFGTRTRLN